MHNTKYLKGLIDISRTVMVSWPTLYFVVPLDLATSNMAILHCQESVAMMTEEVLVQTIPVTT